MHGNRASKRSTSERPQTTGHGRPTAVCAPFVYIADTALALAGTAIGYGAQGLAAHEQGRTGEVSTLMLADIGCRYVIVGHSERRAYHTESDQLVADKAKVASAHGVTPIVCVGETRAEREAGRRKPSSSASLPQSSTRSAIAAVRWSLPMSPFGPSARA